MAPAGDAQDETQGADVAQREYDIVSYFDRVKLRALIDLVLVGTPLVLLLTWLTLTIAAGGR